MADLINLIPALVTDFSRSGRNRNDGNRKRKLTLKRTDRQKQCMCKERRQTALFFDFPCKKKCFSPQSVRKKRKHTVAGFQDRMLPARRAHINLAYKIFSADPTAAGKSHALERFRTRIAQSRRSFSAAGKT